MGLILIFFILLAGAVYLYFMVLKTRARTRMLLSYARENGYQFEPGMDESPAVRHQGVTLFDRGSDRRGGNLMTLQKDGLRYRMFDYRFNEGTSGDSSYKSFSVCLVDTDWRLPQLLVRPEGLGDKVAQLLAGEDLQLDSVEFNRRFWVQSKNPGRAMDFLHPKMMQYLLEAPPGTLEVVRGTLVVYPDFELDPAGYQLYLAHLKKIVRLIPDNLREAGRV